MPFPFEIAFRDIHHGVNNQFHETAIKDAGFLPHIVLEKNISDLSFAVTARSADIFMHFGVIDIIFLMAINLIYRISMKHPQTLENY